MATWRRWRSPEDPALVLTPGSLTGSGSGGAAVVTVTPETALGLTAVWRAVSILASTAASLPLEIRRRKDAAFVAEEVLETALLR